MITVSAQSKPCTQPVEEADPMLRQSLDFLARDIAANPARCQPLDADLVARAKTLVAGIKLDLDAARSPADE